MTGHWVLDIDTKGDKKGASSLQEMETEHGPLPPTFTVRTHSGGKHLWFYGSAPTTKNHLGLDIDTRGVGGYVLIEGSVIDGKAYTVETDAEAAEAPAWLAARMAEKFKDEKLSAVDKRDRPIDIKNAREYLERIEPAIEGEGGDDWTYKVACNLKDIGVSADTAHSLMMDVWNPRNEPPWDNDDLWAKVEHAFDYGQNQPGAKAADDTRDRFKDLKGEGSGSPGVEKRKRFDIRDEAAQDARKEPRWIIPGWLPAAATVMVYGPPSSYKSFIAVDMALSIAAGRPWATTPAIAQGDVVYLAGEGALGIEKQRRPAWRELYKVDGPLPFYVTDDMPLLKRGEDEVPMLVKAIKDRGINPRLLVVDTLNRFGTGMNENDAADASTMIYFLDLLRAHFPGSSIIAVHHAGKDTTKGARGSSALQAGFDVVLSVTGHTNTRTAMISAGAPHGKMKDAEPPSPIYFRGDVVGPSLAFKPIRAADYHTLIHEGEEVTAAQVTAALKKLGEDADVNTTMLAIQIVGSADDEKEVNKIKKQLAAKARGELSEFVEMEGATARWRFPLK